jgi:hypothetical protein
MITRSTIATALNDLLLDLDVDLTDAINRHFSSSFRQRADGVWSDRAEFTERIAHLRTLTASGTIEVHEELVDGLLYAERHTIEIVNKDGSRVRTEVYLFGRHDADGRFSEIHETTLMLSGSEADRNLGSVRG